MTIIRRAVAATLLASAALSASGCAHSDPRFYPYGQGSIYDNAPHESSGWFDGRWYPGHGSRVYDRERNTYAMSKAERQHWGADSRRRHARDGRQGRRTGSGGTDRHSGQPE